MKQNFTIHKILVLGLSLVLGSCASKPPATEEPPLTERRLEFTYEQLQLRDMDQFKVLIAQRMNAGDKLLQKDPSNTEGVSEKYETAVRVLFSRPDQDGARAPIFIDIRKRLGEIQALDRVLVDLTGEAIAALRSPETSDVEKATYVGLLENLMSEIKPEIQTNDSFRKIIVDIRDAKLVLSREVSRANLLRSMAPLVSPSKTAELILKKKAKTKR